MNDQSTTDYEALRVRPLEPRDLTDALEIFPDAIIHLHPILSMAGAELGLSQEAWIAEVDARLIGVAVLSVESRALARLTYLQVVGNGPHHTPAARALAEIAIRKAWDAGYLKLVVQTHLPSSHIIEYMHELGFEFAHTHASGSERVVEFYRNLYEPPRDPSAWVGDINDGGNTE